LVAAYQRPELPQGLEEALDRIMLRAAARHGADRLPTQDA
jgi:hypothetical protein